MALNALLRGTYVQHLMMKSTPVAHPLTLSLVEMVAVTIRIMNVPAVSYKYRRVLLQRLNPIKEPLVHDHHDSMDVAHDPFLYLNKSPNNEPSLGSWPHSSVTTSNQRYARVESHSKPQWPWFQLLCIFLLQVSALMALPVARGTYVQHLKI